MRARIKVRQKGFYGWFYWTLLKGDEVIAVSNATYPQMQMAIKAALRAKRLMASAEIEDGK